MSDNPYDGPQAGPTTAGAGILLVKLLVLISIIAILAALIFLQGDSSPAGPRTQCLNNIRNINVALLNYRRDHSGRLPPAYTTDENGNPLHSWRTLLLPYLDHQQLFDSIDLKRPWNDPVNKEALPQMPDVFRCPSGSNNETTTTYLAIVDEGSGFSIGNKWVYPPDSESSYLLLIDMPQDKAVPWMSPQDATIQDVMQISEHSPLNHPMTVVVAYANGSASTVEADASDEHWRKLIIGPIAP